MSSSHSTDGARVNWSRHLSKTKASHLTKDRNRGVQPRESIEESVSNPQPAAGKSQPAATAVMQIGSSRALDQSGIGSAAIVAALLYASQHQKKPSGHE
jgi:hypothetical protein